VAQSNWSKTQFKRIRLQLGVMIIIGIALFLMPPIPKQGLELFLYKILLFSASQVHAHLVRLLMFSYIDFSTEEDKYHKLMVIAIHVAAAYVYGVGG
jgi:heme/copper-type cytochrome/quinol oxidase subunit 4